jgi:hypothetical protein
MSNASTSSAPNSNLIYLFALGSVGVATGLQFAASSLALYAAVVAIGGIAGMIVTRAGLGKATLAFLVSSGVAAALYYFVIAGMLNDAASTATAGESAEVRAAAASAGEAAGNAVGTLVAGLAFVQTFVPGFLGSAIGALVRPKQRTTAAASQPAMAAR